MRKTSASVASRLKWPRFCAARTSRPPPLTGNKASDKLYRRHSGRPGGMKVETFAALQQRIPERIVEKAIKGMLPHNALGRQLFRKLKVYKGAEHPHGAQQPQPYQLNPSASIK